ncbi:ribonuclease Z [Candidatus Bathyarchaeota archaeon]|nr:MAG: ribonuclease Z [Candidatus Bathyarchaeota archaeon]
MSLRITFLGTAASIPTSNRALSAVALKREGELFLFDCGEGTQRQMIKAKIGFNRKTRIFITHMHGDHILGLPGILQTMSLLGRDKPLEIYGPQGIAEFVDAVKRTVGFSLRFPVKIYEVGEGLLCKEDEYEIRSAWAEHSVPSLAYALIEKPRPGRFDPERAISLGVPKGPLWSRLQRGFNVKLSDGRIVKPEDVLGPQRPGRKIVYVGDTKPSENIVRFAFGADVLIHEATFAEDLAERAEEDMHSTPSGAALIAKKAKVNLLILTHISARYSDPNVLLEEAKRNFENVLVAEDFMKIDVPLKE